MRGVSQQIVEHETRESQADAARLDVRNGIGESRSIWLSVPEGARYTGRSIAGFRRWAARKGLVAVDRCYSRRDIDKARAIPRKRHAMSPVSLANLRKGR